MYNRYVIYTCEHKANIFQVLLSMYCHMILQKSL